MYAIPKHHVEVVRTLIKGGININAHDSNRQTVLIQAISYGNHEIIQAVLDAKPDIHLEDRIGRTALHKAVISGYTEVVKKLIEYGARLHDYGKYILYDAINGGNTETLKFLIQQGLDPSNIPTMTDGTTALMWALIKRYPEIAKVLIQAGANTQAKNNHGETALMIAANNGFQDIVEMLSETQSTSSAYKITNQKSFNTVTLPKSSRKIESGEQTISLSNNKNINIVNLSDALYQIRFWVESSNSLDKAEVIPPGLSLEEIQDIVEKLPFRLPEEVYEVYQWSHGHIEEDLMIYTTIFDDMSLCSLRTSMEIWPLMGKNAGKPLFPIFKGKYVYLCVIGDWENKKSSPVILVTELEDKIIYYTAIESMMLTYAECFTTDSISYDEAEENGYIEFSTDKFGSTYLKYNSTLPEFSVKRLKEELTRIRNNQEVEQGDTTNSVENIYELYESNKTRLNKVLKIQDSDSKDPDFDVLKDLLVNLKKSKNETKIAIENFLHDIYHLNVMRLDLVTKQLDFTVVEPLIIAAQDEDEIVRNLAREALGILEYTADFIVTVHRINEDTRKNKYKDMLN